MEASLQQQISPVEENHFTSSRTGTLYFAYGSNLSPSQMRIRCSVNPEQSATPVAIARLDGHSWFICERGYANVKEIQPENITQVNSTDEPPAEQVVYGVLYDMVVDDVLYLDGFEGCGPRTDPHPQDNPDPAKRRRVPHLQRHRDYNKHYLPVTVSKWLVDPAKMGITGVEVGGQITVLVYVDEQRLSEGNIVPSYIGRMNRAIRESAAIGMPLEWMEKIMRKWVTAGVELKNSNFIGASEGHKEDWLEHPDGAVEKVSLDPKLT